jgi:hypothetical protein
MTMLGRDRRQRRRRVAAVGGAALAAKKHHDAKQAEEQEATPQAPSAEPAGDASPAGGLTQEAVDQLKQLGELHDQNVLSDEEFEREKAKLLGSG